MTEPNTNAADGLPTRPGLTGTPKMVSVPDNPVLDRAFKGEL
jgi:hypothetical protein